MNSSRQPSVVSPRDPHGRELMEHIAQRRARVAARQQSPDPVEYVARRGRLLVAGLVLTLAGLFLAGKLFSSMGWIR